MTFLKRQTKRALVKTMEVAAMSKITLDQAKIDMYINLLERGAVDFSWVHKRWKDRVRKELKRRGLSHLAN